MCQPEQPAGAGRLTTFYGIGDRPRPVQYTVVDGWAVAEGCIILGTADEAARALDTMQKNPGLLRKKAKALGSIIRGGQHLWPDAIVPYQIDAALPDQKRVTDAIALWEQQTNKVKFVLRSTANAATYPNYVDFIPGSLCASSVGMQSRRQVLTLSDTCTLGNCIHEIGHALGLWHEQSRLDRDAFVEIVWTNILQDADTNFYQRLYDGDDSGAYDFGSIMHYEPNAFSNGKGPTIRAVRDTGGAIMGQREALSAGDRAAIAAMYP